MRRLLLIAVALISLAVPAASEAAGSPVAPSPAEASSAGVGNSGSNPFSVGVPQSGAATATATTPSVVSTSGSTSSSGGFSTLDGILVAAGVVLVIAGITGFVWWDSRRSARHLRHHQQSNSNLGDGRHQGSKAPARSRKLSAQEKKRRKRGQAPRRR